MKIEFLSLEDYCRVGLRPTTVFGSDAFLRLNQPRAESVVCAVADNRIGIAFGLKNDTLCSPWSAPYMALSVTSDISLQEVMSFGTLLRNELSETDGYKLVTPPTVYGDLESAFFEGFRRPTDIVITDTSFHVDLKEAIGTEKWNRNSRRNLKRAVDAGLQLVRADSPDTCYRLIAAHHHLHNYEMAMTEQAVIETAGIVPADFWMVVNGDGEACAGAYCFKVRDDIVQVINSGDTETGREDGAMTFMAYALISHYRHQLLEEENQTNAILDYGPTSVQGVQNEGLFRFKTGFGGIVTPKFTLISHQSHTGLQSK